VTDTKKRMTGSRLIALWLVSLVLLAGACPAALAQGTDTVYDEVGVLTGSQEQNVQEAFDSAQEEAGQPIYAFLVPDTGVSTPQERQDLLTQEASVPQDAGVIMVAPKDRWDVAANLNGISEDAVSNAMEPDFADGNFAAGLIAGANEIKGGPVAPPGDPEGGAGVLLGGGLLVLLAGAAALILFRNRRARRRRIELEAGAPRMSSRASPPALTSSTRRRNSSPATWRPSARYWTRRPRSGSRGGSRTPVPPALPRSSTRRPPFLPPILSGRGS
jgi:hypothetical protein